MDDANDNPINSEWLAEFRGFFFGEGFLGIVSWGKHPKGYSKLVPRAQITCRSDDVAILHDICSKLGGFVYTEWDGRKSSGKHEELYQSNPYSAWRITKASDIRRLCDILEGGLLPSRKKEQISTMREFLATCLPPGKRLTDELYAKRQELHLKIKALHQYSGS